MSLLESKGLNQRKLKDQYNVRNVDSSLNKKRSIEYMVEVNIYYQEYRERTEIDVIKNQK